jgi:hypothetical protein
MSSLTTYFGVGLQMHDESADQLLVLRLVYLCYNPRISVAFCTARF